MIMPRYKSILVGCEFVTAGRARKCYHNPNHRIAMGDMVLEVKVGLGCKGYCLSCAREMLRLADDELAKLRGRLP